MIVAESPNPMMKSKTRAFGSPHRSPALRRLRAISTGWENSRVVVLRGFVGRKGGLRRHNVPEPEAPRSLERVADADRCHVGSSTRRHRRSLRMDREGSTRPSCQTGAVGRLGFRRSTASNRLIGRSVVSGSVGSRRGDDLLDSSFGKCRVEDVSWSGVGRGVWSIEPCPMRS